MKVFYIATFFVVNVSLLLTWAFIVHKPEFREVSMYTYAAFMLLWTILGTISSVIVCKGVEPKQWTQQRTFTKITKSIVYWLFIIVMIYEAFINLAYANFHPWGNMKAWWLFWPVLRVSFIVYTFSHTFSIMRLLEAESNFDKTKFTRLILAFQFSLDFAIWTIGALNLASLRDENWASPIFPNWEFTRKIFWSAILAFRVYMCTVTLKIINTEDRLVELDESSEGSGPNESSALLYEDDGDLSIDPEDDLNTIQKWILVKPNFKFIGVVMTVSYLMILISAYNPNEKYISCNVNHFIFICVIIAWLCWSVFGMISFRHRIKRRTLGSLQKKWLKYLSFITFAVIGLLFSVLYMVSAPTNLGKVCGFMIMLAVISTFVTHQFMKVEFDLVGKKFAENVHVLSIVIGFIAVTRVLAIEEIEVVQMHHDGINIIPLEVTVPLAIDYFVHVFIHNIYNYYKRMHFILNKVSINH